MPLQDEGVNENEDIEKGVIVSDKVGIDVHKFAIGFIYASREFGCWNSWAVFTGLPILFGDLPDMDTCGDPFRHYCCRSGVCIAHCRD